jgi:hypothetical protein
VSQLRKMQENLAKAADLNLQNKAKGLCIKCGLEALPRCYSIAGVQEFHISGMCEKCFDSLYDPRNEE